MTEEDSIQPEQDHQAVPEPKPQIISEEEGSQRLDSAADLVEEPVIGPVDPSAINLSHEPVISPVDEIVMSPVDEIVMSPVDEAFAPLLSPADPVLETPPPPQPEPEPEPKPPPGPDHTVSGSE